MAFVAVATDVDLIGGGAWNQTLTCVVAVCRNIVGLTTQDSTFMLCFWFMALYIRGLLPMCHSGWPLVLLHALANLFLVVFKFGLAHWVLHLHFKTFCSTHLTWKTHSPPSHEFVFPFCSPRGPATWRYITGISKVFLLVGQAAENCNHDAKMECAFVVLKDPWLSNQWNRKFNSFKSWSTELKSKICFD